MLNPKYIVLLRLREKDTRTYEYFDISVFLRFNHHFYLPILYDYIYYINTPIGIPSNISSFAKQNFVNE